MRRKKNNPLHGKKLKIIITGGAGFIGSWVVDCLLADNDLKGKIGQIIVMDTLVRGKKEHLREALKSKKVKLVKKDIRDVKAVNGIIAGSDYVIHEAAIKNILCDQDPRLCQEVLINGTFNIMEACIKYKVKKLVFNSSASVYGQPVKLPMKEDDLLNNQSFYGAGKIANEEMAKAFRKMYSLNYIALRPFNVYGPRMDISGLYTEVFIKWLDAIDSGHPPLIHGDGKNTLDFIYVEDVAKATVLALKSSVNEGTYNIGSGKETSLKKLAEVLLRETSSSLKPEYKSVNLPFNYATRRRASITRMQKYLKFKKITSLEVGVKKLIEWRKSLKAK